MVRSVVASGLALELLFAGEREGRFCVVTEARAECVDVRSWLERRSQMFVSAPENVAPEPEPAPPPQPTGKVQTDIGEFTFTRISGKSPPAEFKFEPVKEPGDFTIMFGPGSAPRIEPDPPNALLLLSDLPPATVNRPESSDELLLDHDFKRIVSREPAKPQLEPEAAPETPVASPAAKTSYLPLTLLLSGLFLAAAILIGYFALK
jgi:hypothetical protein